jgi:hypothetical protein
MDGAVGAAAGRQGRDGVLSFIAAKSRIKVA